MADGRIFRKDMSVTFSRGRLLVVKSGQATLMHRRAVQQERAVGLVRIPAVLYAVFRGASPSVYLEASRRKRGAIPAGCAIFFQKGAAESRSWLRLLIFDIIGMICFCKENLGRAAENCLYIEATA